MESISGMESSVPRRHYQNETVSSTLPPYFHGETERITNAFRSGSCWSVKQLPHVLEYGEVQKKRHANATNNLLQKPPRIYKAVVVKKHFWNIPYVPTTYDKYHVLEKSAFEVDRNQIESTGRKAGLVIPSRIRAKYEDIFEDINYQYPTSVLGPAVGIPKLETIVREDFSDLQRFTCGTRNKAVANRKIPEKELGVEWTKKIFGLLARDWAHLKFTVKFTKSDELLVQFEMAVNYNDIPVIGVAMLTSLGKYMTTMVTHGVAAEFGLKKRGDRWGQLEAMPEQSENKSRGNKKSLSGNDDVPTTPSGHITLDSAIGNTNSSWHGDSNLAAIDYAHNLNGANEFDSVSEAGTLVPFVDTREVDYSSIRETVQQQTADWGAESSHNLSPINNSNGENAIRLLTYSMYAPWVSVGSLHAARAAAFASRQAARKRLDEEKDIVRQERLKKLSLLAPDEGISSEPVKHDPKLLHIAMHGLRKSAKDFLYSKRPGSKSPVNVNTSTQHGNGSSNGTNISNNNHNTSNHGNVSMSSSFSSPVLKSSRRGLAVSFESQHTHANPLTKTTTGVVTTDSVPDTSSTRT